MKIYEVFFDHQIEGGREGVFESLEKAEKFLAEHRRVKLETKRSYMSGSWHYTSESNLSYSIQETSLS